VTLPSDAEIHARLRAILATPEFQGPTEPGWWTAFKKAFTWIVDRLSGLGPIARWAILLGAVAALGGLIYHIITTFARLLHEAPRMRQGTAEPASAREPTCEELLADARRFRADGQLRQAARALQQARLLLECRRRAVTWRRTLADWEWMAVLGRPAGLIEFTRATQTIAFGADPSAPAVEACERRLVAELAEQAR
jgi:hypothetical protein